MPREGVVATTRVREGRGWGMDGGGVEDEVMAGWGW